MIQFNTVLDLANAAQWHLAYEQYKIEQQLFPPRYPKIDGYLLPITFDRYVLACSVTTELYKDNWFTGGWLTQRLDLAGTDFGRADSSKFRLPLNRTTLLVLPNVSPQYQLWFDPAPWLIDMTLRVWEFTGAIATKEEELLDVVRVDLARIEAKINTL